jgi:hypothetical protein
VADIPSRTRYGIANPERIENPLWRSSFAGNWTGYELRELAPAHYAARNVSEDFSHSDYRDGAPGPLWAWNRSGRTSTLLLDGRIIHVAGEHEDWYDADFCIYNDVVVEHPDGRLEFLLYPKDIFPPTDFHSATLIGRSIFLIGSIGYRDMRKIGETQVFKLDTETLQIERVATTGENPGWIGRHTAQRLSDTTIGIANGIVMQTPTDGEKNTDAFTLDIATLSWRREPPGAVFAKMLDSEELEALEAAEIELALADEKYPIEPTSSKLLQFFERSETGNWTCTRPIAIAGENGEVLLVRPRQTFSQTVILAGINIHEELGYIADRSK